MIEGIPEVSDFEFSADTPRCTKCGGPMDEGNVRQMSGQFLTAETSVSPQAASASIRRALICIACGYTEIYADPTEVRCVLAGVTPPKPQWKRNPT